MKSLYQGMIQGRADLRNEGNALLAKAERSAEEDARLTEVTAELAALNGQIEREEKIREALRNEPALPDRMPAQLRQQPAVFGSLAEQLVAVRNAALPGGMIDNRLLDVQAAALGAQTAIGSEGGFLLQTDYVAGVWQRVYDGGQIISRCFKVPIGGNADSVVINGIDETSRATGSRWGGVRAYWVAEAGTITASQPKFRRITLAPHKLAVIVYATSEMLRNGNALEAVVNQVVPQEIRFMAENAIVNGTGAGQPLGIINAGALISVTKETNQAAATVVAENIQKMWARRWGPGSYVWLVSQDVEAQFDMMSMSVGVGGQLVYMPPGGLSGASYGSLKGKPVLSSEYSAALGTTGDIMLADFSQYAVSDRGSVQAASSIHVQFLTDQTCFRFTYEIDGQPLWASALTPFNGGSTQSAFVKLDARA
jgi:HK97 family phage major capsid protein